MSTSYIHIHIFYTHLHLTDILNPKFHIKYINIYITLNISIVLLMLLIACIHVVGFRINIICMYLLQIMIVFFVIIITLNTS